MRANLFTHRSLAAGQVAFDGDCQIVRRGFSSRPPIGRWWCVALLAATVIGIARGDDDLTRLETQFRTLPLPARRLTGPLFWLHGCESQERLDSYLEKVLEGGNGCFTAESRPHNDWLGPGWYRDLEICVRAAERLGLQMWIFDEEWWPSGEVGGKVPQEFASKHMQAEASIVEGPATVQLSVAPEQRIVVLAGRLTAEGVDSASLLDLTPQVHQGQLDWEAPAGTWQVMRFAWRYDQGRNGRLLIDGAESSGGGLVHPDGLRATCGAFRRSVWQDDRRVFLR